MTVINLSDLYKIQVIAEGTTASGEYFCSSSGLLDFKENNDSYHIEYTHGVNPPVFPFGILEKDCLVTYYIIFDGNILVSQNENISNIHYMYNIETETFYDVKDLYGSGWGLQSQYSTKWKTENFPTMDDIKNMSDNVKNLIIK